MPTTLCTTLDSVNPVLYPSIDTILIKLCVLLTMSVASATVVLTGHLATVYGGVWKIVLGRPWRMTGYLPIDWCIFIEICEVDLYKAIEVAAKTRRADFGQF